MVKIKIDETYSIGLLDRMNIVLVKYGPIVDSKGNVKRYDDKIIGFYGTNFSALIKGMIENNVTDANVHTLEELDRYVRDFVEGINFDGIIKEFHSKIMDLERERKHLEKKLKKAMDKGKE